MSKFIYISKPHLHTDATLRRQVAHIQAAMEAAKQQRNPPLPADKLALYNEIRTEQRNRLC